MEIFKVVNNYYSGNAGSNPGACCKCGESCQSTRRKTVAVALVVAIVIFVLCLIVSQCVGRAVFVEFCLDAVLTAVGVLFPLLW